MKYIGIDLHRRFSQVCVYDAQTAQEKSYRLDNDKLLMYNFFMGLGNDCKIAVEATGNWYWLVDLLQSMGLEVLLSNPVQTKAIANARVKNDTVDAATLAHLLRADLLPTCWIPKNPERNLRDLLRMRLTFLCFRTQFKNVIRSVLAKFNINLEKTNLWYGEGRDILEETIAPEEQDELTRLTLPSPYCEIIQQSLLHIDYLTQQIKYWEEAIHHQAVLSEEARRLLTVPGIGELSALTIIYESGPIERFPSAKHYVSYAGLVPRNYGSADKYWNGHLCKQANMYLKRIYVEIALAALRSRLTAMRLKHFYERVMRRKGRFVARIALARKLAGIVYHILKNKIDYATCMERNSRAERASLSL